MSGDAQPPAWRALRRAAADCRECPLGARATQTVWGDGPNQPALMLVGEQPGDREDIEGRPFVGAAGRLLDRALAELGWPRDRLYVTNAVKHFKYELRGTRRIHKTPAQLEILACAHWLESEIESVKPHAIVALGATAARSVMGRPVTIGKLRGEALSLDDGARVVITIHPSALLRMREEAEKRAAYAAFVKDLKVAAKAVFGKKKAA